MKLNIAVATLHNMTTASTLARQVQTIACKYTLFDITITLLKTREVLKLSAGALGA